MLFSNLLKKGIRFHTEFYRYGATCLSVTWLINLIMGAHFDHFEGIFLDSWLIVTRTACRLPGCSVMIRNCLVIQFAKLLSLYAAPAH